MFIYTNKFDRISPRKGNIKNFIISTSVCDCAECACWLSWLWGIASLYSDMLRYSSLKWVWFQVSLNPWKTRLILTGWLVQMGTSSATATQRVLAVAQTVLRHSLGISLVECTSSWQESFTVDKFGSKSFVYSFTKTKGGITPREGIKRC